MRLSLRFLALVMTLLAPSAFADTRVLVIGDSHGAGVFGQTLNQALIAGLGEGSVWFYAASSAKPGYYFKNTSSHGGFFQSPANWAVEVPPEVALTKKKSRKLREAPTPELSVLIEKSKASSVVVELGTNLLRGPLDKVAHQISEMATLIQAQGRHCIWVGAPSIRGTPSIQPVSAQKQQELFEILKKEAVGCQLIDSRKFTRYPEETGDEARDGDGIHFNGALSDIGRQWALRVAEEVLRIVKR